MKCKLILLILQLFIGITPLFGANDEFDPKRYKVSEVPNVKLADKYAYVSDPENALEAAYIDSLNVALTQLEDSTGVQCAVVVLPAVEDDDINSFSYDLFNTWKLGDKENNNGLLVVLLTADGMREVRFETGYGLEGDLPDAVCKRIQMMTMIPYLKEGNYGAGLLEGVRAVSSILDHDSDAMAMYSETQSSDEVTDGEMLFGSLLMIVYVVFGFIISFRPIAKVKKMRKDPANTPFQIYEKMLSSSSGAITCLALTLYIPFLPLIMLVFFLNKSSVKRRALICPKCGKKVDISDPIVKKKATYSEKGEKEISAKCQECDYAETMLIAIPKLQRSSGGSFSSGSSSSWSSGGSSSSGGSWGGGSSGGGGSSSRF